MTFGEEGKEGARGSSDLRYQFVLLDIHLSDYARFMVNSISAFNMLDKLHILYPNLH